MNKSIFGSHVTLDCNGCDKEKMYDIQFIYNILDELPDLIDMHKIIPPYVFPYCGEIKADRGVTGIVIIAESHITIHTFPEKDYMFFDIFSCAPFDEEFAINYIINAFDVKKHTRNIVQRGINFPRGEL